MSAAFDRALLDTSVMIDYPSGPVAEHTTSGGAQHDDARRTGLRPAHPDPLVNAVREQRYHWIINTFGVVPFNADVRGNGPFAPVCDRRPRSETAPLRPSHRRGGGSPCRPAHHPQRKGLRRHS